MMMDPAERQRAQTFYENMRREKEDSCCKFCDKVITQDEMAKGKVTMLQSTDCWHQVHISCLVEEALRQLSKSEPVCCPRCDANIQQYELNEYLTPEHKAQIEKNQILEIVKANPDMVNCTCGNAMMMEPGQPDYKMKDDKGQVISPEAARHMAQYRIRCPACNKNFCTKCNAEPYHVGRTCDQAAATNCRFCGEELKQPSPSMKPAFKDVCRKSDCMALMNKSCDKMLPCGHPCRGLAGETNCMPCLE
jgi:hypothetical protein